MTPQCHNECKPERREVSSCMNGLQDFSFCPVLAFEGSKIWKNLKKCEEFKLTALGRHRIVFLSWLKRFSHPVVAFASSSENYRSNRACIALFVPRLFDSMPRPQAVSPLDCENEFFSAIRTCCSAKRLLRLFSAGIQQTINDDSRYFIFNFIGNTCSCTLGYLFCTRRSLGVAEAVQLT